MKKLFLIIAVIGIACSSNVSQTKRNKFEINETLPSGKPFYIEDSTKYSGRFIKELREMGMFESLKLIDNKLFITHKMYNGEKYIVSSDTITIPNILPLNTEVKYQAETDSGKVVLTLQMKNLTTLFFELKKNERIIEKGEASLIGGFFLGAETNEDENENAYIVIPYYGLNESEISIRIRQTGETATVNIESIPELKRE